MKFFKGLPQFDIMGKRTLCYVLSAVFMLASIGLFFTKGINYGIDFKGGTLVQVRFLSPPEPIKRWRSLVLATRSIMKY